MEFEDVLEHVGSYGKYQQYLMITFFVPITMVLPYWYFINLFFLSVPNHWCYVPELELRNWTTEQEKELVRLGVRTSCSVLDVNYSSVLLPNETWNIPENATSKDCPQGWRYDKTNYEFNAATQWNMVCEDSHYVSFVLTMANVGSIVFTPIYGSLSDRLGRKPTFFIVVFVTSITVLISVFMTNFTAFVALRTINGSFMPSIFQLPCIMLLEVVGPDMRARMNGIANIFWTLGMCALPLFAWLSRDWIKLGLGSAAVAFLLILYWPFVSESPRFLLSKERYGELTTLMSKIAEKNGKSISSTEISAMVQKVGDRIKKEKNLGLDESSPLALMKYPQLKKKFLILTYCWVSNVMAYYGLQMNAYNLAGNEFLNFFLLAIAEMPGYLSGWLFMEKIGRRWCSVSAFTLTGLACFMPVLWASNLVSVIASFIAKYGAAVSFMAMYQQCSELYHPTTVRATGMGASATWAQLATLTVPYIIYLNKFGESIPFIIMTWFSLTAAFSASFLPETLNENLPQTIADAESFGLHQKFFSCNRRKQNPPDSTSPSSNDSKIEENTKC